MGWDLHDLYLITISSVVVVQQQQVCFPSNQNPSVKVELSAIVSFWLWVL
jgi:hypothetical protein